MANWVSVVYGDFIEAPDEDLSKRIAIEAHQRALDVAEKERKSVYACVRGLTASGGAVFGLCAVIYSGTAHRPFWDEVADTATFGEKVRVVLSWAASYKLGDRH